MTDQLYQERIVALAKARIGAGKLAAPTRSARRDNPLCGDRVTVYLQLGADGRVADIKFEGKGCAISQASASMMTDMLMGRSQADAEKLMQGFLHLVKGEDASDLSEDDRERLEVMGGISEFPMRVKCATLAWHTYKSAVEEGAT